MSTAAGEMLPFSSTLLLLSSAVKTVAAWRQCREESYQKVRKVIEYVHIPSSFLLITFPTFPQKVLFSFVPQFFPFTFLTFPNNFPHFFSFFLRTGLTVLLIFHHILFSSCFFIIFLISPHHFPNFSSHLSSLFLKKSLFPLNFR